MHIDVSLDRQGAVHWDGKRVSMPQFTDYLEKVHRFEPEPLVFLETEMGAPCATLEAVRDQMETKLECNASYSVCAEGILTIWRNLPTPPGTPPS